MIDFKDFIDEAKQVGTIYHFTKLQSLHGVLDNDCKMGSHNGHISTTRNYELSRNTSKPNKEHDLSYKKGYNVRITMDGNKISQNHKIRPILGYHTNDNDLDNISKNHMRVSRHKHENEEAIDTKGKPFDAKPHIKRIDILSDNEETYNHYHSVLKHKLDSHNIKHSLVKKWEREKDNTDEGYSWWSRVDECYQIIIEG